MRSVLFLILLIHSFPAIGSADPLRVRADFDGELLGTFTEILEDASRTMGPLEAQQSFQTKELVQAGAAKPNFGLNRSAYWLRFTLENPHEEVIELVLESSFALTDSMRLYRDGELLATAGDQEPYRKRQIKTRQPALPMTVQPGRTEYLLRIQTTGGSQAPLYLWSPANFTRHNIAQYALIGFFIGCFALVGCYNFFIFVKLRDRAYFYYVVFIFCNLVYQVAYLGILQEIAAALQLDNPIPNQIMVAFVDIILISLYVFSVSFLRIREHLPKAQPILKVLMLLSVANLINTLFFSVFWGNILCLFTSGLDVPAYFYMGYLVSKKRITSARWYTAAFGCYLIGASFTILNIAGLIGANVFTYWGHITGSAVEGVLLSLALADRFNEIKKQQYEAEKHLIKMSAAKDHSYNQLAKIVYPHQIKSIEMGAQLEDTMPTNAGEGVVICFDIIGSSKLKHIKLKDFLESSIHACLDLLQMNYDPASMQANGYRIKEMGDGFLCSLNYPFAAPQNCNFADMAYELANEFILRLEKTSKAFQFGFPIHCGIGIVMGQLQGYYTKSNPKEYDMFGRGIVLATRYEALRKQFFADSNSHSIIIQTTIFNSLSMNLKKQFMRYNLQGDFRIRDDAEAEDFYYKLIPSKLDSMNELKAS